jgi:hypothetical protein
VGAQGFTVSMDCGATSASQLRTTLYFGRARPKGSVSELEWRMFLRDEATRRFPEGLTVWEAEASGGQPPAASITSSRRSCSWSTPIRRRRGNQSRPSSRRIARSSSSNPFCGKAPASASQREERKDADPKTDAFRPSGRHHRRAMAIQRENPLDLLRRAEEPIVEIVPDTPPQDNQQFTVKAAAHSTGAPASSRSGSGAGSVCVPHLCVGHARSKVLPQVHRHS